jgi:hypothetical protein
MKTLEDKITTIVIALILIILLVMLTGCMSSIYKVRKDQIKVTHVLAIAENGDTLKIPIEAIKPNVIYNIIGYDYGRYYRPRYYYRPYNYIYDYYPYSYTTTINSSGNTFGISTIRPTIQINVPSNNNNSGTSGFSNKPLATNPVISGGGVKKKNKFNQ